ncbi:unnamed protein product, partial [marine sediment metagenome]
AELWNYISPVNYFISGTIPVFEKKNTDKISWI